MPDFSKIPQTRIEGLSSTLENKQNKLKAGQNIVILPDGTISALGGGSGVSAPMFLWYTNNRGNTITVYETSENDCVSVYKNGLLLQPSVDYTIASTTLTLTTPVVETDKIILSVITNSDAVPEGAAICCVADGAIDTSGNPAVLEKSGTNTVVVRAGGSYPDLKCIPANGSAQFTLSADATWTENTITSDFRVYVICVKSDGTADAFLCANNSDGYPIHPAAYMSATEPSGRLWMDIRQNPVKLYSRTSTSNPWDQYDGVPVGYVITQNGEIQKVFTFPFNIGSHCSKLIDSYSDSYSWYRVYGDGWCEQGGRVIGMSGTTSGTKLVQLHKSFFTWNNASALYNVESSRILEVNASAESTACIVIPESGDGNRMNYQSCNFVSIPARTDVNFTWRACGYIF